MDNNHTSSYEQEAANNMKLRDKILEEMDSDVDEDILEIRAKAQREQEERKTLTAKRRRTTSNPLKIRFPFSIPEEYCRRSSRLQNKPVNFSYEDILTEEKTLPVKRLMRNSNKPVRRLSLTQPISVEDITREYINNFAESSVLKIHSVNGTTCHQCRQKTLDSKTVCRSGKCYGTYGQFCAPCLKNRYGEVAQEVILNPNWSCPYCRGRCNCSICRTRQGKRPTGILAPVAFQEGFNGVSEYLDSLDGYGDYQDDTKDSVSEIATPEATQNVSSVSIPISSDNWVTYMSPKGDLIGFEEIRVPVTNPDTDELLGFKSNVPQ